MWERMNGQCWVRPKDTSLPCSPAQARTSSWGNNRICMQCFSIHPPGLLDQTFRARHSPCVLCELMQSSLSLCKTIKLRIYRWRKLHRISHYGSKNSLVLCVKSALLPTHMNQFRFAIHHPQPSSTLNNVKPAHILFPIFAPTVYLWQGTPLLCQGLLRWGLLFKSFLQSEYRLLARPLNSLI